MKKILTILLASVLMLTGSLSVAADNTTDVQKFTDVSPTDYFYEPVKWASKVTLPRATGAQITSLPVKFSGQTVYISTRPARTL